MPIGKPKNHKVGASVSITCPSCDGTGKKLEGEGQCPDCKGTGKTTGVVVKN